jgi:hypothetical protein
VRRKYRVDCAKTSDLHTTVAVAATSWRSLFHAPIRIYRYQNINRPLVQNVDVITSGARSINELAVRLNCEGANDTNLAIGLLGHN